MDQVKIYDNGIDNILENHQNLNATAQQQYTCRLCLNRFVDDVEFWNIFDNDLPQKLMAFAAVELQQNDGLPTYICTNCRNLVYTCYNFKCQVEKSDHDLHQALIISQAGLQWQTAVEVMAPCFQKDIINSCATVQDDYSTNSPEQFIFDIASSCDVVGSDTFRNKDHVQTVDSLVRSMENNNLDVFQVDNLIVEDTSSHHKNVTITFQTRHDQSNELNLPLNLESSKLYQNDINISLGLHNSRINNLQETSKENDIQKSSDFETILESLKEESVQENSNQSEDEKPLILRTKRHKCNYCIKSFANLTLLQKHLLVHKKQVEIVYSCYLCNRQFTSIDEVKDHTLKVHGTIMDKDKIMENVTMKKINNCVQEPANNQKSNLVTKNIHLKESKFATLPKSNFDNNSEPPSELNTRSTRKIILKTTENFESNKNITSKLRSIKIVPLKQLRNKDFSATKKSSKSENDGDRIYTNNCNSFNDHHVFDDEKNHKDSKHDENDDMLEKNIQCNQCGTLVSTMRNLKRHMLTHSGFKCKCSKCDKEFSRSDKLKEHQDLKHKDMFSKSDSDNATKDQNSKTVRRRRRKRIRRKRPYQCKLCPKSFAQPQSLENHELRHKRTKDGTKRYLCDVCSKIFAQSGSLIAHMRIHTGVKPYVCNVCSRAFTKSTYLQLHLRTHSGEKPYSCEYCNKSFARANTLARHITVHTGEAKYQCETCKKFFRRLTSLNEHAYTHTGQKPYSCKFCSKRYNNAGSLYAHSKKCKTKYKNEENAENIEYAENIENAENIVNAENTDSLSYPVSLPASDDNNTLDLQNEFSSEIPILIYSDKSMSEALANDAILSDSAICQFMINIDGDKVPTTPNIIEAFASVDTDFYNMNHKPHKTPYYGVYSTM